MASLDMRVDGVDALVRDLAEAGDSLAAKLRPVVVKGAVNVKAAMRADMAGSRHFGQVARSITFDSRYGASLAEAEVGPETRGQTVGDLAHFAYFGGAHGGGGTVRDPQAALDEESPRFAAAVGSILDELLR